MKAIEFFSGIGGFAFAAQHFPVEIVRAWDNSEHVVNIYNLNFKHQSSQQNLDSISLGKVDDIGADIWWMSPPCAPYTRRGKQKHLADHRTKSFLRLIEFAAKLRPPVLMLENVEGFKQSRARRLLKNSLKGYAFWDGIVCPHQTFGIPNRRKRYYAVAIRDIDSFDITMPCCEKVQPCRNFLEQIQREALPIEVCQKFGRALHVVNTSSTDLCCFTGGYGKSWAYCGSYLSNNELIEIFSPREIANFLGFPSSLEWPEDIKKRQQYKYLGNSLSVPIVTYLLREVLSLLEKHDPIGFPK